MGLCLRQWELCYDSHVRDTEPGATLCNHFPEGSNGSGGSLREMTAGLPVDSNWLQLSGRAETKFSGGIPVPRYRCAAWERRDNRVFPEP